MARCSTLFAALAAVILSAGPASAQPGGGGEDPPTPTPKRSLKQPAGSLGIRLQPRVDPPTVKEVFANTTAAAIGVKVGDVVLTIDGIKTPTVKALVKAYRGKKRWAGDAIKVSVQRKAETLALEGPLLGKETLVGKQAPAWKLRNWHNTQDLPKGLKTPLTLAQLKGRVVVMLAFLSWCPTCHKQALPAYAKLEAAYPDRSKVVFVYVQTVHEGYQRNGRRAGERDMERFKLKGPMAHDPGVPDGRRPVLMTRYKTGGTPWSIVIDGKGIVRYTASTPSLAALKKVVDAALGTKPAGKAEEKAAPPQRD